MNKQGESVLTAVRSEKVNVKKIKPGSNKHLAQLRGQLPDILFWQDKIKAVKGKEAQAIRNEFREKFQVPYTVGLMEKLTGSKTETESNKAEEVIIQQAEALVQKAADDELLEKDVAGKLKNNSEFQAEAVVIDQKRNKVVGGSIVKAGKISGLSKIMNKILKEYPYFEEKKLKGGSSSHNFKKQDADMSKDISTDRDPSQVEADFEVDMSKNIPTDRDPSQVESDFENEILSQRQATLEEIKHGKHKDYSEAYQQVAWPEKEAPNDTTADEILAQREQILNEIKEGTRAEMTSAGKEAEEPDEKEEEEPINTEPIVAEEKATEPETKPEVEAEVELKAEPEIETKPEVEAEPEVEVEAKYNQEIMSLFESVGLSQKDLDTIPGLDRLNDVSLVVAARSLKMVALENTDKSIQEMRLKTLDGKKPIDRVFMKIQNVFRQGKFEREALAIEAKGGLEKHGAELTRLVEWASSLDVAEKEKDGKVQMDFIGEIGFKDLKPEQQKVLDDFNDATNKLSTFNKHAQTKKYEAAFEQYQHERNQCANLLHDQLKMPIGEVLRKVNEVDAKLNMIQFMSANPDLNKEWSQLAKGSSILGRVVKKDNWKYLVGGYAGRSVMIGAIGSIAIPLAGAAIGALRGHEKAKKELVKSDKQAGKKNIAESEMLAPRREIAKELNELVPAEYAFDPKEWLKTAAPAQRIIYHSLKNQLAELDSGLRKEEQEQTNLKTLKAEDLNSKMEFLINKLETETDEDKKIFLVGQLQRRLDFSKKLADEGLINFGSIEDRTTNSLDFYQTFSQGRVAWLKANFEMGEKEKDGELTPENRKNISLSDVIYARVNTQLRKIEKAAGKNLSKSRRKYIAEKMISGAFMGATFATAGAMLRDVAGDWVQDKASDFFRFVRESVGMKNGGEGARQIVSSITKGENSVVKTGSPVVAGTEAVSKVVSSSTTVSDAATSNITGNTNIGSVESVQTAVAPTQASSELFDTVSNEGLQAGQTDSVWRSVREIFINNAEKLGYNGDLDNASALKQWAETQTNESLANSGDVVDKVFAGNKVILERSGDSYLVSVEDGTGATPDYLPVAGGAETGETLLTDNTSDEVISNLAAKSETAIDSNEIWADQVGAKYGLNPDDVEFVSKNIIVTDIDDKSVYIDVADNTYHFFNSAADEISGFLVNDAGTPVTDLKEFLNQESIFNSDYLAGSDNVIETAGLADQIDLSPEGIKASVDSIGLSLSEHSASSIESLQSQALENIQTATGLHDLKNIMSDKETKFLNTLVENIKENGYNKDNYQKDFSKFISRLIRRYGE